MDIFNVLTMIGGVCLFLFGMSVMGEALEKRAGNSLKTILSRITGNKVTGFLLGLGVTAVIQSSGATTVMAVGFVNSGLMTLSQAINVIMGANVGTTVTAWILSLSGVSGDSLFIQMLKPTSFTPILGLIGIVMYMGKDAKRRDTGMILLGFATLMFGMDIMSDAVKGLKDVPEFTNLMLMFSNPIMGVIVGAVMTGLIQSSSASVGILQALSSTGQIPLATAIPIIMGQNIGSCVPAMISSVGTNKNARRTATVHLMFNIIGTFVFTILCLTLPVTDWISSITPDNPTAQIANMHTIFNIATTLLLIPFGTYMAKFAVKLLPDPKGAPNVTSLGALTDEYRRGRISLGFSAVHTDLLRNEIIRILTLAEENTSRCYQIVLVTVLAALKELDSVEETIDSMNKEISQYISNILVHNNNSQNVSEISEYFLITGNAERIGDHASNIGGYTETIRRLNITFSDIAREELTQMQAVTRKAFRLVLDREGDPAEWLAKVAGMEQKIDDMTKLYRQQHLDRMHQGLCSEEACILYSELLTDFERIGDHILNIAQAYSKIATHI